MSTFEDWAARSFGPWLVPVIPPNVLLSPNSKVPASQRGKVPGQRGGLGWASYPWRDAPPATSEDLDRWQEMGAGIGLRLGPVIAADIDVTDGDASRLLQQVAEVTLGESPPRVGRAPKATLFFRAAPGMKKRRVDFSLPGDSKHAVEILADGQYSSVDGVHATTLQPYAWPEGRPALADLPTVDDEAAAAFMRNVEMVVDMLGGTVVAATAADTDQDRASIDQASLLAPSLEALEAAVAFLPNEGGYDDWIPGLCSIKAAAAELDDGGREIARGWSDRWSGGGSGAPIDFDAKWDQQRGPYRLGWNWIALKAAAAGWGGGALIDFAGVPAPVLVPGSGRSEKKPPVPKAPRVQVQGGDVTAAINSARLETMQECIFSRYVWIEGVERVGDTDTGDVLTEKQFKIRHPEIGPPSSRDRNAFSVFTADGDRRRLVQGITYLPGGDRVVFEPGIGMCFNKWRPSTLAAVDDPGHEAIGLWLQLIEHLIPDAKARGTMLDAMAFMLQHQAEKLNWAPVLGGLQGIGKDMAWQPVIRGLGQHNVGVIGMSDIESANNDWCVGKRMVIVNEAHSSSRVAVAERMKQHIAAPPDIVLINTKNVQQYSYPNRHCMVFFTNRRDAISIERGDRRYFVWWCECDKLPREFYRALLGAFAAGGYEAIVGLLMRRDLSQFSAGGVAPMTDAKAEMARDTRSEVTAAVEDALEAGDWPDLVNFEDLAARLNGEAGARGRGFTARGVGVALKQLGAKAVAGGFQVRLGAPTKAGSTRARIYAIRDVHRYGAMPPAAIARSFSEGWAKHDGSDFNAVPGLSVVPSVSDASGLPQKDQPL